MTQKSALKHDTPVPESHERQAERDTLNDTPELRFLRDEIEALLGSTTVQRATRTPIIHYADDDDTVSPENLGREWLERATESEETLERPEQDPDSTLETAPLDEIADDADEDERADEERASEAVIRDSIFDRDTEPSVDAKLVQEAVRTAGH